MTDCSCLGIKQLLHSKELFISEHDLPMLSTTVQLKQGSRTGLSYSYSHKVRLFSLYWVSKRVLVLFLKIHGLLKHSIRKHLVIKVFLLVFYGFLCHLSSNIRIPSRKKVGSLEAMHSSSHSLILSTFRKCYPARVLSID